MQSPEERLRTIREQVDAKIHWGDSREDVAAWLGQKHGILGEEADQMLDHAYRERHAALRERALIRLLLGIVGLVGGGIYFYIRYASDVEIFKGSALVMTLILLVIIVVSLTTLLKSVNLLLGQDDTRSLD